MQSSFPKITLLAMTFFALASAACANVRLSRGGTPPDLATRPFTADQIRQATSVGQTFIYAKRRGDTVTRSRFRFTAVTPSEATVEFATLDADDTVIGEVESHRQTWEQLESHATYDVQSTRIIDVAVTVPAGTWACKRYTIHDDSGRVRHIDFATALPGPPIRTFETSAAGEVTITELVAFDAGTGSN